MKPSEALRIAREKIASGQNVSICLALPKNKAGDEACNYISKALFPNAFYETWIRAHYPKIYGGENENWVKEGRLQWIDWMIKEYERIGQ